MKEIINYSRRVMRDERIMKDLIKIILSENLLIMKNLLFNSRRR